MTDFETDPEHIAPVPRTMRQEAPWPDALERLVAGWRYRPGWQFVLADIDRGQGSRGLTLDIVTHGYNAYHPERGQGYDVHHYMPVPPAAYDDRSWRRWILEQCMLVERHEACEFTAVVVGVDDAGDEVVERPWAPSHAPGSDPYLIRELGTDEDRRTSFRGVLNPS